LLWESVFSELIGEIGYECCVLGLGIGNVCCDHIIEFFFVCVDHYVCGSLSGCVRVFVLLGFKGCCMKNMMVFLFVTL